MIALLQFLVLFIVISVLLALIRFIFMIIKGIFILKRSVQDDGNYEYENSSRVYNNYENGKTIELGKDQYKVE